MKNPISGFSRYYVISRTTGLSRLSVCSARDAVKRILNRGLNPWDVFCVIRAGDGLSPASLLPPGSYSLHVINETNGLVHPVLEPILADHQDLLPYFAVGDDGTGLVAEGRCLVDALEDLADSSPKFNHVKFACAASMLPGISTGPRSRFSAVINPIHTLSNIERQFSEFILTAIESPKAREIAASNASRDEKLRRLRCAFWGDFLALSSGRPLPGMW